MAVVGAQMFITHPCAVQLDFWMSGGFRIRHWDAQKLKTFSPSVFAPRCIVTSFDCRIECRKWTLSAFIVKFIRRCVRQMHELRLDKHLKTKEVEMLALATINIISVDEKVENLVENLPLGGELGGWVHCHCSLVQRSRQQQCLLVCKKSDYNSDSFKTHGCTRRALH